MGKTIRESDLQQVAASHGLDWHYRDTTDSTNADVMRHFEQHGRDVVAVSEAQSAGRGRRGRDWVSPHARNIYCTIGLRKTIEARRQGLLSIVTGLALCRVLERIGETRFELKWPNDLIHDGHKLGGILIESRTLGGNEFFLAIGFGINVFMPDDALDGLAQPATSLDRIVSTKIDRSQLLGAAIAAVCSSIREFEPAAAAGLIEEFKVYDAYHGQAVEVSGTRGPVRGISLGITDDGQLRLQTDSGIETHAAAEISLRPGKT